MIYSIYIYVDIHNLFEKNRPFLLCRINLCQGLNPEKLDFETQNCNNKRYNDILFVTMVVLQSQSVKRFFECILKCRDYKQDKIFIIYLLFRSNFFGFPS